MPRLSRALHAMLASGAIDRRTANHLQWEADNPQGAIKARRGRAVDEAVAQGRGRVRASRRTQRNNRREY